MRFLRRKPNLHNDRSPMTDRLSAVERRVKQDLAGYEASLPQPEVRLAAQQQRVFWTPAELADAAADA